jgi:hypothetical protein
MKTKIDDLVLDLRRIRKEVEVVKEELDSQRESRASSIPPPLPLFIGLRKKINQAKT